MPFRDWWRTMWNWRRCDASKEAQEVAVRENAAIHQRLRDASFRSTSRSQDVARLMDDLLLSIEARRKEGRRDHAS